MSGYIEEIKDKYIILNAKEKVLVYIDTDSLHINDYIEVTGKFTEIKENTNFNLFNYRNYLLSKNIKKAFVSNKIKIKQTNKNIKYHFYYYVKKYNSKYMDMFLLQEYNYDLSSYKNNGIIHLFSISGMHITIISMYLIKIMNTITKRSTITYLITISILTIYAYIINFPISVLRSLMMFTLAFLNKTFNLKINNINLFLLTIGIALFTNPFIILRASFYFSYIISFFIMYIKPKGLIKTSFVSYISSFPLLIYNYFNVNLISVLLNLIFIPIITLVYPLTILTLLLPNSVVIDTIMSRVDLLSIFFSGYALNLTMAKPGFFIIIIYYYIILLSFRYKKIFTILLLMLLIHHNIQKFTPYNTLHMLDVKQGDSFLFSSKDFNILIDTGDIDANHVVMPYLKSMGVNKINYLILTHGHSDHLKEAINIIESFNIGCVFFNTYNNEAEHTIIEYLIKENICYENISEKIITHKDITLTLKTFNNNDENQNGIITNITFNDRNILLMADVYQAQELKLNYNNVDVLKIAHHGSKTSTNDLFINKTNPKVSLISVGEYNKYNHPNKEVIEKLDNYYQTSINGGVIIEFNKNLSIKMRF